MQVRKRVRKLVGMAICCSACMIVLPANAFFWLTIDAAEISSIKNDVTNGASKITGAVAQVKNYISTIQSIGDQASLLQKYAKDIKSSLDEVKSNITNALNTVESAANSVVDVAKDVNTQINKSSVRETGNTQNIVKTTENLINNGESKEIVQAKIEETKEDIIENYKEDSAILDKAQERILKESSDAQKVVNDLIEQVNNSTDLDSATKNNLQNQAQQLSTKINNYSLQAKEIFDDFKINKAEDNKKILNAYDEYNGMVTSYYKGSVKKDDLSAIGNNLQKKVQEAQTKFDEQKLMELTNEGREISKDIKKLKETILDSIANKKEYSDEDDSKDKTSSLEVKKSIQYVYHTYEKHRSIYLTGIYADKDGEDKSFLISKELDCNELKFDDINKDDKLGVFIEKLRHCIVQAKAEKDYFCNSNDPEELRKEKCDPYVRLALYTPYKEEGVYKHILEDYEVENITNLDTVKQYSSTWLDTNNKNSTLKNLSEQLSNIKDERSSTSMISIINMEAPKLWSYLRRANALIRAKDVITLFKQQENLYLDKRDNDFVESEREKLGSVDGANVISNGILYGCGVKGEEISVAPDDKNDEDKIKKAEEKIKECIYKYAAGASLGTINGEVEEGNVAKIKEEWNLKRTKAYNDSMFHTFVLSTINNYKSSRDYYSKADEKERNIITLQKSAMSAENLRDDYASATQIVNYSTRLLLSIVNSDAQALQSEIISDIRSIRYDFFDTTIKEE